MTPFHPRIGNQVNWYGLWTLYLREVTVSVKMAGHTLLAPMIMGLLFLAVFSLALGGGSRLVSGVPFLTFLGPGLVMMGLVHAAFEGAANSILHSKLEGTIVDVLMPPLGPTEFVAGHIFGGATRGLFVATAMLLAMQPFVSLIPVHPGLVLFHAVASALVLAMLGLIAGLWAQKWDNLAMINNFTITPLAFLSGVFFSTESLPELWRAANLFNPFFYMIDGFRYGFIGHADASPSLGIVMILTLVMALWLVCHRLVATGYKLKP
jgi:ABC-2 type transport system permease protein